MKILFTRSVKYFARIDPCEYPEGRGTLLSPKNRSCGKESWINGQNFMIEIYCTLLKNKMMS